MFLPWLPNNLQSLRTFSVVLFTTGFIALLLMRLSQCLPQYKMKRRKKLNVFNIRTMVIFGSGVAPLLRCIWCPTVCSTLHFSC
jgi:hypothetical protein